MSSCHQQSTTVSTSMPSVVTAQKRPAPRGSASYPRKRAVKACQVCRSRKTKCDNAKPACSFCVKVGATCIQTPVDLSSFDPASLQILQRLDDLEQLVREGNPDTFDHSIAIPNQLSESLHPAQLLPCPIDSILEWISLRELLPQPLNGPAFLCIKKSFEPHRVRSLLDNFFNFVHVKNPVLDEQQTRRTVNRVCLHGIDWSPDACLSLLICALGTIATPLDGGYVPRDSEAYMTAESFFLTAKKRLGLILGTSSLIEAQCMFLAGVYSICTFDRMAAWRYFMQSLACCRTFQSLIGFRREYGDQLDEAGRWSAAAEQAIYWSAWKSEREVNQELNLPGFLFSELDAGYPPLFPTPPSHDSDATTLHALRQRRANTLLEIKESTSQVGQSHIDRLAQEVADREAQVSDWVCASPRNMSINNPPEEDDVCRFVLRGHLINVWEIIYWPFVEWAINSTIVMEDEPLLREYAMKGLQIHMERIRVNRAGFAHRHHGTFYLIKSCTQSALILLAAARSRNFVTDQAENSLHVPIGWQSAVKEVIHLLEAWEQESADLSSMANTLRLMYRNYEGTT
ncbi:hypothetical protein COCVIDRAFT_42469 [Bipolaris victoriae FI3]|uniref:Zn(2)-C6 fungal-type domain-containing protein n=1 Tax=Bipolaris victoriae (strain FI3) TaxID=930091 RepID=W7DU48_BIPV3|nr:hypothetical protein COCVIDRAFT_42469 [Bipolaris victoriae FI3]